MNGTETPLPDYDNPPVVEVAISIQFDPLRNLRTPHIGLLWKKYNDKKGLKKVEEQPPLPQIFELFGKEKISPSIEFSRIPPVPRVWFLKEDGSELVQVQEDRFVHNWVKNSDQPYPRYKNIKTDFLDDLNLFEEFIKENLLGELHPNQCELTYVNHIPMDEVFGSYNQVHKVIGLFDDKYTDSFLCNIEKIGFNVQYIMNDENANNLGRLHIAAKSVKSNDQEDALQLTLIARGKPLEKTKQGVIDFFDIGNKWIVKGFTSITTSSMHEIWRKIK